MLIAAVSAGICTLCLYSVYGNVIRHETTLHDLRNRVETLQNKQILHVAELKGEISPEMFKDVELVPDEEDPAGSGETAPAIPFEGDQSAEPVSSETNAA